MKNTILKIIDKYLKIFPEELERQTNLIKYLEKHEDKEIINWNNFNGHICAGGFIYSLQKELTYQNITRKIEKLLLKQDKIDYETLIII